MQEERNAKNQLLKQQEKKKMGKKDSSCACLEGTGTQAHREVILCNWAWKAAQLPS